MKLGRALQLQTALVASLLAVAPICWAQTPPPPAAQPPAAQPPAEQPPADTGQAPAPLPAQPPATAPAQPGAGQPVPAQAAQPAGVAPAAPAQQQPAVQPGQPYPPGQPPPVQPPATTFAPPPTTERLPIDEHTGFYLQLALGGAYVSLKDEYTGPLDGTETVEGSGPMFSVLVGGGVGAGIVIAGGLESFSGELDYTDTGTNDGGGSNESTVDGSGVVLFAMFQKYFGAFYIRGLLGGMAGGATNEDVDYGGVMFGAGLGADFLVSRSWALGGSLNYRYTSGSYSNDGDGYSGEFNMNVLSLQFTATLF